MTTTGSGTGDFFEYQGVQTCQINIDNKFSEMAELLKSVNDYMNSHIHCPETEQCALRGELGKRFLDDWNANASTFSDFYENFRSWSLLMSDIIEQYGTFDHEAVENAIEANQTTGATLKGVAETRAAQQFNENQWKAEQTQQEIISESLNPVNMAKLGWEKSVINNAAYYNNDKVNQTISDIAKGVVVYDTDDNAVNGLKLCPDMMDEEYFNEYMIYEGVDVNGNKQYYSIETDGELKLLDKEHVKSVGTVSENLKVGDTFDNDCGIGKDDAVERISKASYIIGYDSNSNQTYMALPHSDGTVEYYTVKGHITSDATTNNSTRVFTGEITNVNITAEQVQNAGFNPLYVKQDYSKRYDLNEVKEQYSGVQGVQGTGQAVDNGSYKDGQYYGTVTGGGVPAEEEEKQDTTPIPYTGTSPYVTTLEHDEEHFAQI